MRPTRYDIDCHLLRKQLSRINKLRQNTTQYFTALLLLQKSCSAIVTPTGRHTNENYIAACQFLSRPDIIEMISKAAKHIRAIARNKDKKALEDGNSIRREVRMEYRNSRRTGTGYGQNHKKVSGGLPK